MMPVVPALTGRRRTAASFSFPVFIFFVLCHVLCLSDVSTDRLMDVDRPTQRPPSIQPITERHRRHERKMASDSIPKHLYPVFIEEPTSKVVGAGRPLWLNCSYVSHFPVEVRWLLNGSVVDPGQLERMGVKISKFGVSRKDDDDDDDDDVDDDVVGDDDDDDVGGGGDDDDDAGKKLLKKGIGHYSNYQPHSANTTHDGNYQDDDDDDDEEEEEEEEEEDNDDVGESNNHGDDDDEEGVLDVTNFRARDFPKQRPKHKSQQSRKTDKRHIADDKPHPGAILDRTDDNGGERLMKRDTENEEEAMFERPKSSIYKSLEILYIPNFAPEIHEGIFQCLLLAGDLGSMLSREAKVASAVMTPFDTIQIKTTQLVAYLGGTVIVPCVPPVSRPEAVVEFNVNGSRLNLTDRHLLLPSGNLQVSHLSNQDAATYRCLARNPVTGDVTEDSILHSLNVIVPSTPQPTKYSRPHQEFVTAILGQNLTLECWAQGWPQPQIKWEKYGGHLPWERSRLLMGNLLIERVESTDAGTYLCEARNEVGNPPGDKVFSVEVLEPPTVFVSPFIVKVTKGKSASITCKVEGAPRPSIQWLHNGVAMGKDLYQESSLVLSNIKPSQAGTYQCFAKNNLGVEQGFARVVLFKSDDIEGAVEDIEVEKFDDPWKDGTTDEEIASPSKPEVTKISNTSVKVKWSYKYHPSIPVQPLDGGSLAPPPSPYAVAFKIQYKEVTDDSTGAWKTLPDVIELSKRSYDVKKLRSGSSYRFRVVVQLSNNESRQGPTSAKVSMATKPSSPVPTIVDIRQINSTQMLIMWQIHSDSWLPDGFVITYVPNDLDFDEALKKQIERSDAREAILADLEPSTQYKIRVHSYSSLSGKSVPSNTVVKKTLAAEPNPRHSKLSPTQPFRPNSPIGEFYEQGTFYGEGSEGSNPPYGDANQGPKTYVKNDRYDDTSAHRVGSSSDKFISQSNLVYILLGSILCLIITIVIAFLISCVIKRRRHEFGEKEKEKLKEKGIERLKQSSSLTATAPLLHSESIRPIAGGCPISKSQTTLASQCFPSQTGIFQQNYQIKSKPSYTGSASVGESNVGQMESPFHATGANLQSRVQNPQSRPHKQSQDLEQDRFYFHQFHSPEPPTDDQNHIYSTLEEPRMGNSSHSSCPSSTQRRLYAAGGNAEFPKEYSADHQIFHLDQNGSHQGSKGQRVQMNHGRPLPGAPQSVTAQVLPNRGNNWYSAENTNLNSLVKEQATNTINPFYDNDPSVENGLAEWPGNAYSSIEGYSLSQDQRMHDFNADGNAISSADSSSLDSDFRAVGTCPTVSCYPRDMETKRDYLPPSQQKRVFYKSEANTTPILPSKNVRNTSNDVQVISHANNFSHVQAPDKTNSRYQRHCHSPMDRT